MKKGTSLNPRNSCGGKGKRCFILTLPVMGKKKKAVKK
jgi:hypothetical protein